MQNCIMYMLYSILFNAARIQKVDVAIGYYRFPFDVSHPVMCSQVHDWGGIDFFRIIYINT